MLYAIIAFLVIIADQWIKLYVTTPGTIPDAGVTLIPGFLNLRYVENTGGPFGFLSGQNFSMWFIIIAGVFALLVIIALATKFISGPTARWSLAMVAAGGVSNALDRVVNFTTDGHVVDMFQFSFTDKFPVFNLADIVITIFCIIFIFAILFGRSGKRTDDTEDEFTEDEEESLDEEEEERPRRGRKAKKAAPVEAEEEEESEEASKPARSSRKARQARYDEEYEQYKAAQRARQEEQAAAEPQPATVENPSFDPADPFAEWERANAAQRPASKPAPVLSGLAPDPQFSARPAAPAQPVAVPVEPAPAAPAPKPAEKPVEAEPSFDLDDILAEFK